MFRGRDLLFEIGIAGECGGVGLMIGMRES